jgi:hypothetical protein
MAMVSLVDHRWRHVHIDSETLACYLRGMKTLKACCLLLLLAMVVVGCGKVENILPSKEGTWTSTSSVYRYYVNSALDSTFTDTDTYTFNFQKGGALTLTDVSGPHTLTWSVNPGGDIVTLCSNTIGSQDCEQYVVKSSSKDSQSWSSKTAGSANGEWVEHDLALARK